MSTLFPRKGKLNKKHCWDLCWKDGGMSLTACGLHMANEGIVSGQTGKPFSPSAIKYAQWAWALKKENQAEAYADVKKRLKEIQDRDIDLDTWKRIMVEQANHVFVMNPKKFSLFIVQNGLQQYVNETKEE